MIAVTVRDNFTGKTVESSEHSAFWWCEGNGACDCNRGPMLGVVRNLEHCDGCSRFYVIGVIASCTDEMDGYRYEEFNGWYPFDRQAYASLIANSYVVSARTPGPSVDVS